MNERIKQLAEQAGFKVNWQHADVQAIKMKRFEELAELIVEEMYDFMCKATDNDGAWPSSKEVKQHFGVEE